MTVMDEKFPPVHFLLTFLYAKYQVTRLCQQIQNHVFRHFVPSFTVLVLIEGGIGNNNVTQENTQARGLAEWRTDRGSEWLHLRSLADLQQIPGRSFIENFAQICHILTMAVVVKQWNDWGSVALKGQEQRWRRCCHTSHPNQLPINVRGDCTMFHPR